MDVSGKNTARSSKFIIVLCGVLILFDGYDLVVFGNVVPALLHEPGWQFTPLVAGRIAALTLIAMAVGAVVAGTLSDRFGRRRIVLASLCTFSLAMIATAVSPTVELFEASRIVGGVGLGALFPTVTALIMEFAPARTRNLAYSYAFFGYLIGGILAAGLGMIVIDALGWRAMFWVGALPLVLLPVLYKILPESPMWLISEGRIDAAREVIEQYKLDPVPVTPSNRADVSGRSRISLLFGPGYSIATVMFWITQFCSLLLVTGMITWLPTIMTRLDYSLGFALAFTLILNVGAALGAAIAARQADRFGAKPMVVALFTLGALAVVLITLRPPTVIIFVLIAAVGAGSLGAQILTNAFGASLYPAANRGAGLGLGLAIGRIGGIVGSLAGGSVLASHVNVLWIFYLLAGIAALGAIVTLLLPLTPAAMEDKLLRRGAPADPRASAASPHP